MSEAPRPRLPIARHRAGLPGNVDIITGSAFLPAYKSGHPADLPVKGPLGTRAFLFYGFLGNASLKRSEIQPFAKEASKNLARRVGSDV